MSRFLVNIPVWSCGSRLQEFTFPPCWCHVCRPGGGFLLKGFAGMRVSWWHSWAAWMTRFPDAKLSDRLVQQGAMDVWFFTHFSFNGLELSKSNNHLNSWVLGIFVVFGTPNTTESLIYLHQLLIFHLGLGRTQHLTNLYPNSFSRFLHLLKTLCVQLRVRVIWWWFDFDPSFFSKGFVSYFFALLFFFRWGGRKPPIDPLKCKLQRKNRF